MNSVVDLRADEHDGIELRAACIAPRPKTVAETGLGVTFLGDLIEKHLHVAGVMTLGAMGKRTALAGAVLEEILHFLRREGRVEIRARTR